VSGVGIPSASGRPNQPDLVLLTDLIEKGMVRPVIERRYMLATSLTSCGIWKKAMRQGK